ncbi:MAG: methyltransferase domain-containing protein [Nocardiopsaceae bacterium]|jgi:ubiquinone/menaquinone biosynthesis C-methylase UbiE|nr:methyltransferase domain-containing protein [Nocardiopsaceae bacterium]
MDAVIDRVRLNGLVTWIAFGGRRRLVYRRIVELSGAGPGDLVLDVGCSSGYLARLLLRAVGRSGAVTGVDPSRAAIGYARRKSRRHANMSFTVGAAQRLDFPDGSFDVVTCTLALHHIPEAERADGMAEMFRVLRPGGELLVADFSEHGARRAGRIHRARRHMHNGHGASLEEVATAAGFVTHASGDLPMLHYVRAFRPERTR